MKPLSHLVADWPVLSALLDQALALPAAERPAWLAALPPEQAAHRFVLQQLLDAQAQVETDDFLAALPALPVPDAALPGLAAGELAPGQQVGPWRLLAPIGSGGMGTVWRAERADGGLERSVALKLPRLGWDSSLAERLNRERRILDGLAHAHIARLYDAGVDILGRPWLAMEYVEGERIDHWCQARHTPLRARVALLLQVADAMAHAHARLVVHRDLKPANILVTAEGQVSLLDFGIAKLLDGEQTHATALTELSGRALTLDYASPEQIRGEPQGTASDIYSMAVVAFEVLAGVRPYRLKRGSAAELEEAIASAEAPLASSVATEPALRKALRGDLDAILNRGLKKSPAERYPTMEAFAQDLRRWLGGEPVQARPDRLAYRTAKFVGRHRLPVAAGVAVVVALVLGASVALWQAGEAREQAKLARAEAASAKAVQNFLQSVFLTSSGNQLDASKARQTPAQELLDRGAERIDKELADVPEARLNLYGTLGNMYTEFALYDKAIAINRRELALAIQLHGNASNEAVSAMTSLSGLLGAVDQRSEELRLLEDADAAVKAMVGDTRSARLKVDRGFAEALWREDQPKALVFAQRAAVTARALNDRKELVLVLQVLGDILVRLRRNQEAQAAVREALALIERQPELGRNETPLLYAKLAEMQNRAGQRAEADANFAKALAMTRAGVGQVEDPHICANKWASSQYLNGQYAEGIATLQPTIRWARQLSPSSEFGQYPATMIGNYGRLQTAYGHPEEGLRLLDEAMGTLQQRAVGKRELPPSLHGYLQALRAETLVELGRLDEAQTAILQAQAVLGDGQNGLTNTLTNARRRVWLANGHAQEALKDFDTKPIPASADPAAPFIRQADHAWIALNAGQDEVARTEATAALAGLEASHERRYLREPESLAAFTLGKALLHQGFAQAARAPLQRAVALKRAMTDSTRSLSLADVLIVQAEADKALHDTAAAQRALAEARAIHARHPRIGDARMRALAAASRG